MAGGKNKQNNSKGAGKKLKADEDKDFEALMKKLSQVERSEPQATQLTTAETKARRKKKAQDLREAKEEQKGNAELTRRVEQHRQQQQLQQIMHMIQTQNSARMEMMEKPVTKKDPLEEKFDESLHVAVCGMQGWRRSMEDAHTVRMSLGDAKSGPGQYFFGVYDGHVGDQCAKHLAAHLPDRLVASPAYNKDGDVEAAMRSVYLEADAELRDKSIHQGSGCTAVTAVITRDKRLICANVGDSRAVLCRDGKAVELSVDHKPSLPEEEKRIVAAGGTVSMNRVNGQLAMSRAMGDFGYKSNADLSVEQQLVTPVPDIYSTQLTKGDEFIVVACDGVWDMLTSADCVDKIRGELDKGVDPLQIVQNVADACCCAPSPNGGVGPSQALGTDNISLILIVLKDEYRKQL